MPTTKRYYYLTILSVAFLAHLTWRMSYFEYNPRYCLDCGQVTDATYFSIHICNWHAVDTPIQDCPLKKPILLTKLLDPDSACTHERMKAYNNRRIEHSILLPHYGWAKCIDFRFLPSHLNSSMNQFKLDPQFTQYVLRERPDIIDTIRNWYQFSLWSNSIRNDLRTEHKKWQDSLSTSPNPQSQPVTETQPAE